MNDKNLIIGVVVFLLAIGVVLYVVSTPKAPTTMIQNEPAPVAGAAGVTISADSSPTAQFAQCLKESGAVFYGAFWCPHCQAQEALFGEAKELLPYIECSTPNGRAQIDICVAKKITGYPTWEFADGSRLSGEQTFAQLAEKSGCRVPE